MIYRIDGFPGREIIVDGQKHLYFGGTSYLGLQTDPQFQEILIKNIKKYGTGYGASRKSNVRFTIFEEVENHLANLAGSESCVTMSSGYLAAQLLVRNFSSPEYKLFYAPHTHSALHLVGSRPYATYTALNIALKAHLEANRKATPVVLLDSIDFSGCNYPDFTQLKELPLSQVILIIDDSHGIGIVGDNGGGVFNELVKAEAKELIVCASLGKAFGVQAGAVFGKKERIRTLMETDFFGGASPATPAGLATLLDSKNILEEKRIKLQHNISFFLKHLKQKEGFFFMKDYPVFSFMDEDLATYLEQRCIITTNFSYPSDGDSTKSRIVLGAQHDIDDIQVLLRQIADYKI
ncbi:aminotransferase class I/II-fold pyridoxal phosphate-dependent enzyme [Maribacter algicola]|uniref:Aminotransferase class I/II-fold pyridoxal phosphate-dependent enzyme n=1 Tax=Meishania litoralis TaxID=3434685 RepID=A0ACC7LMD7_9FLAO